MILSLFIWTHGWLLLCVLHRSNRSLPVQLCTQPSDVRTEACLSFGSQQTSATALFKYVSARCTTDCACTVHRWLHLPGSYRIYLEQFFRDCSFIGIIASSKL